MNDFVDMTLDNEIMDLRDQIWKNKKSIGFSMIVLLISISALILNFSNYSSLSHWALLSCGMIIANIIFITIISITDFGDFYFNRKLLNDYLRMNVDYKKSKQHIEELKKLRDQTNHQNNKNQAGFVDT